MAENKVDIEVANLVPKETAQEAPFSEDDFDSFPEVAQTPPTEKPVEPAASKPPAVETATPPSVTAPTPELPKASHPRSLIRLAMQFGATREQIDAATPEQMDDFIESMSAQAPPKPEVAPEPDEIDALEKNLGLDPAVAAFLRKERKEKEELRGTVKTLADRVKPIEQAAKEEAWDAGFDSLGKPYEKIFGTGSGSSLEGKALSRRNTVLREAGIKSNDSQVTIAKKIKAKAEELYGDVIQAEPAKPAESVPAYSGVPAEKNGKPRITEEQWKAGTTAAPTAQAPRLAPGRKAAMEAAKQWFRDNPNAIPKDDDLDID